MIAGEESIWDCTVLGFGATNKESASSHIDEICLDISICLDGKQLSDKRKIVFNAKLIELAKSLGKLNFKLKYEFILVIVT